MPLLHSEFVTSSDKRVDIRLWLLIALMHLMPAIYSTVRIFFLSSLPETWSLSIAAQSTWLHLIYEVLQEALILPLYFIIGEVFKDQKSTQDRVSGSFLIVILAYGLLTTAVVFGGDALVSGMAQYESLRDQTVTYIRFEAIAIMVNVLNDLCTIILVMFSLKRLIFILLFLKTILTVFFDSLFLGSFHYSLGFGVVGVAWANIAVGVLMLIPSVMIFSSLNLITKPSLAMDLRWLRTWWRVGSKSGLESFVRNLAFALLILRMMNELNQAALFWVATSFIWTWLLLPVLALGTLVRQDAALNRKDFGERFSVYLKIIGIIMSLWLLSVPGWEWFLSVVVGVDNSEDVFELVLFQIAFYIVFSFNHMLDSYFYGVGRTDLMLYQSILVNIFYYGGAFILYISDVFVPDLYSVALLFGGGIVIDSTITWIQFNRYGYARKTKLARF